MGAPHLVPAAMTHGFVGQRRNQAAMDEAACVGVRRCQPKPEDERFSRLLRIDWLPGIGERTTPGLRFKAGGNVAWGHAGLARCCVFRIERETRADFTAYKVLNVICAG